MDSQKDNFISYYNQFKDKIFVYFLYRVNFSKEIAEDLTSDVFLKAYKSFENFDMTRSFQAWIYAIAHNHLVNHYKVAYRESYPLEDSHASPSDLGKIEIKYELEMVLKEINSLESSDKEILLLKFVDQLNNAEIAALLGKEEGAVRTKLSRSLAKLREKLEK